jgi:hypothetical protein
MPLFTDDVCHPVCLTGLSLLRREKSLVYKWVKIDVVLFVAERVEHSILV